MSDNLLELSGVHTHIGAYHILHGVHLAVPRGQLTMLLGRNGAGKTTLLESMLGLRDGAQGELQVLGCAARALDDATRSRIGHVPQQSNLFAGQVSARSGGITVHH